MLSSFQFHGPLRIFLKPRIFYPDVRQSLQCKSLHKISGLFFTPLYLRIPAYCVCFKLESCAHPNPCYQSMFLLSVNSWNPTSLIPSSQIDKKGKKCCFYKYFCCMTQIFLQTSLFGINENPYWWNSDLWFKKMLEFIFILSLRMAYNVWNNFYLGSMIPRYQPSELYTTVEPGACH